MDKVTITEEEQDHFTYPTNHLVRLGKSHEQKLLQLMICTHPHLQGICIY